MARIAKTAKTEKCYIVGKIQLFKVDHTIFKSNHN